MVGSGIVNLEGYLLGEALLQKADMIWAPPMRCHMVMDMEILRDIHWESIHLG